MSKSELPQRFYRKIELSHSGCWNWTAYIDECGYGRFRWKGTWKHAHRVAYTELKGIIPDDLETDHLCRNRKCVNPEHLELVSHQENCRRAAVNGTYGKNNREKTHCPQGHPYDEKNTYLNPTTGDRQCVICRRAHADKNYRERRAHNK